MNGIEFKEFTPPTDLEIPDVLIDAVVDGQLDVNFSVTYNSDGSILSRSATFYGPTVATLEEIEDDGEDDPEQPALFEMNDDGTTDLE